MKNYEFWCTKECPAKEFIYEFMENHEFIYDFMKKTWFGVTQTSAVDDADCGFGAAAAASHQVSGEERLKAYHSTIGGGPLQVTLAVAI